MQFGHYEFTIKGKITFIGIQAFAACAFLNTLVLENVTSVPTLEAPVAFMSTPIENKTGYIYVPDNLVNSWNLFSKKLRISSLLFLFRAKKTAVATACAAFIASLFLCVKKQFAFA